MKCSEPLYSIEEAYNIGMVAIDFHDMISMEKEVHSLNGHADRWGDRFSLVLMCTAYTAGMLQGKREERQRHKST